MPFNKFALIPIIVISAAAVTVWLAYLASAAMQIEGRGLMVIVPVTLAAYAVWRWIVGRTSNSGSNRYGSAER